MDFTRQNEALFALKYIGEDKIPYSILDLAVGATSFISYLLCWINFLSVPSAACMNEVFQTTHPKLAVCYACTSHYSGFKTKAYSPLTRRQ